tara:strand:- start:880 stop:1338 length:459 start_codon:yes stop_codon:yes gene_type:complete
MDKTYNHRRNIISEKSSTKMKVVPGAIVRFSYSGKDVNDKRPLVLVLNPRFKGKLHGLNISYISESVLKQMLDLVRETAQGKIRRLIKMRLPLLRADIGDPYRFYHSRLKGFLKSKLGKTSDAYRTYNYNGVSGIRIIDYKFKGASWSGRKS